MNKAQKLLLTLMSTVCLIQQTHTGIYAHGINILHNLVVGLPVMLKLGYHYMSNEQKDALSIKTGLRTSSYSYAQEEPEALKKLEELTHQELTHIIGSDAYQFSIDETGMNNIKWPWRMFHTNKNIYFGISSPIILSSNTPVFGVGPEGDFNNILSTFSRYDWDDAHIPDFRQEALKKYRFMIQREGHLIKQHSFLSSTTALIASSALICFLSSTISNSLTSIPIIKKFIQYCPKISYYGSGPLRIIGALLKIPAIYAVTAQCEKYINQRAEDAITDPELLKAGIAILQDKNNKSDRVCNADPHIIVDTLNSFFYPYFSNSYRLERLQKRLPEGTDEDTNN